METTLAPEQKTAATRDPFAPLKNIFFNRLVQKISKYRPQVKVQFTAGRFLVKTAENGVELRQALHLRHQVFYEELLGCPRTWPLDIDRFDFHCDHMLIIDTMTGACAGTYRLNAEVFNRSFYSATEFDLSAIRRLPGFKLELGRACIHADYRKSTTLMVLWKGICEYMKLINCRYLFGCSSLHQTDREMAAKAFRYLQQNKKVRDDVPVKPLSRFRVRAFAQYLEFVSRLPGNDQASGVEIVPSLLLFYLKCGARVCGEPAFDSEMRCFDYFTLLDLEDLPPEVRAKFFG